MRHFKSVFAKAIGYTFTRMSLYLTVFNFCMLGFWVYDNTSLGEWIKENGYRPGDLIVTVVFAIFAISVLEYLLIGMAKDEENQDKPNR